MAASFLPGPEKQQKELRGSGGTMSAAAGDDGYDTEEEFAKELAALGSSSDSDGEDGLLKPSRRVSTADGTDDDDEADEDYGALSESDGEAGGGGALAALKRRLAEQEAKMDDFDAELQTLKGDSDWKAAAPPSPGASEHAAAALAREEGTQEGSGEAEEGAVAVQAVPLVPDEAAPDAERFRARREYEAAERTRAEEREEARRRAHEEAQEERRRREQEAAEEERRMEEAAARRVAELEAQRAAEAARIEEELRAHAGRPRGGEG